MKIFTIRMLPVVMRKKKMLLLQRNENLSVYN